MGVDKMIIRTNGVDETWYSKEYFENQIKQAHQAGIFRGIEVQFHAIHPFDEQSRDSLLKSFYDKVQETYEKSYKDDEVRRMYQSAFRKKYGMYED